MELDPGYDPMDLIKENETKKESGGHLWSDASKIPERDKGRSGQNRGENRNKSGGSEPIKGELVVVGYPTLRAKTTVEIQGVGPAASGTWYVKSTRHSWQKNKGYITHASLVRGQVGGSGTGGRSPLVFYADIWDQNRCYFGPRKDNDPPQMTFTFGAGEDVVSFRYHCKPQLSKSAGEKGKGRGKGIDLWDYNKPYSVGPAEKSGSDSSNGSGGGGSGSGVSSPAPTAGVIN